MRGECKLDEGDSRPTWLTGNTVNSEQWTMDSEAAVKTPEADTKDAGIDHLWLLPLDARHRVNITIRKMTPCLDIARHGMLAGPPSLPALASAHPMHVVSRSRKIQGNSHVLQMRESRVSTTSTPSSCGIVPKTSSPQPVVCVC